MAGNTSNPTPMGVGSALRRARLVREISVDEAARDTKLRPAQLRALEEEAFEDLGGEVYARAMLRTYAEYLGLRPDKVLRAYSQHVDEPGPTPPPRRTGRIERAIAATRVRDNQRFLLIAAAVVFLSLVGVGLVSRGGAAPAPGLSVGSPTLGIPAATEGAPAGDAPTVDVALEATAEVEVSAMVDGVPVDAVVLRPGEVVSFSALEELTVTASDGGAVAVTVDGKRLGAPGSVGSTWSHTYTVEEGGAT